MKYPSNEKMFLSQNEGNTIPLHCPIILILDTSHSMWGQGLADMQVSLKEFYKTLQGEKFPCDKIDIAAVSMGENLGMLEEFTPFSHSRLPMLSIRPKGHTPIGGALELALDRLEKQEKAYQTQGIPHATPQLILLSDGRQSSDDFSGVVQKIRLACEAGKLLCRVIPLGPFPDYIVLAQIAGNNVVVPREGKMLLAFADVARDVSQTYVQETRRLRPFSPPSMGEATRVSSRVHTTTTARITRPAWDSYPSHAKFSTQVHTPTPKSTPSPALAATPSVPPSAPASGKNEIFLLDGTNILYWDKSHSGCTLRFLLSITKELTRQNKRFLVFFDASTPYKLMKEKHPEEKSVYQKLLQEQSEAFTEVPAGIQADDFLLQVAEKHQNALIISNDQYKAYVGTHPWLTRAKEEGRLLKGLFFNHALCLNGNGKNTFTIPVLDTITA